MLAGDIADTFTKVQTVELLSFYDITSNTPSKVAYNISCSISQFIIHFSIKYIHICVCNPSNTAYYVCTCIPTFRPLCTSLWMSRKGSLISSRSWLSILTIPSLSRTKSRWDPSPQCTTATGCLRPLNTSWAQ